MTNEMNMEQVEARLAEIATVLDGEDVNVEALNAEVDELLARKQAIINEAAEKRSLLEKVATSNTLETIEKIDERKETETMEIEKRNTPEYIEAYANYIKSGDPTECRALLTENGSGTVAVPELVYDTVKTAWNRDGIMALVRKSAEFTAASQLGDTVKQTGAVGMIAGFMVFEDATLPAHANVICGHKNWCCRVKEWAVNVHLQSLDGSGTYIGASAVQGRRIYGHKVTNSKAVVMDSGVLLPTVAIASHTATVTLTSTNATGAKYRIKHGDAWGDWTTYNGSSKPTTQAGDTIEVYGFDADGVRSGIVSQIDA